MYTKAELSRIRSEFWTSFGRYMSPVPSAGGGSVNWMNYKTGVKHIRFTMDFSKQNAEVSVEISLTDTDKRKLIFSTFSSLWQQSFPGAEWISFENTVIDNKLMSVLKSTTDSVNIFLQETWPSAISFLKERMILLDAFWTENKEMFEMMI